jgi:hypothetical protein
VEELVRLELEMEGLEEKGREEKRWSIVVTFSFVMSSSILSLLFTHVIATSFLAIGWHLVVIPVLLFFLACFERQDRCTFFILELSGLVLCERAIS